MDTALARVLDAPALKHDNDNEEWIVDLFAGGGGASQAIFEATGRHPNVAINHSATALRIHEQNHPDTLHLASDIYEVDPIVACTDKHGRLRRLGLLWASPDCTHHSKARGGKPVDKYIRSMADVVPAWVEALAPHGCQPRLICLENVEEFKDWGPVLENGKPCKDRKGIDFRRWVKRLEASGYEVQHREVVAAIHGAPTTRKRLYVVCVLREGPRASDAPIMWPDATFASRKEIDNAGLFASVLKPWRSAADDVIDWSIPCPSIFGRKHSLKPKTHARIAKGIKRYVIDAPRPFIVPVTHTQSDRSPRDAGEPLQTVTRAKGGELAVSAPTIMPLTHGDADRSYSAEDPMRTVTAAPRGEMGVISPMLIPRYGERPGQEPRTADVLGPYPTVVPDGNGGDLAAVHLTKFSENSIGTDPRDPLHTAMAGAPRHGIVAAHLAREFGTGVGRAADQPAPTVMADGGGKTKVVASHLSRLGKGQVGSAAEEPLKTETERAKDSVVAASMIQHNGDRVGRSAEEPVTSLTERSTQQQVQAVFLDKYYGAGVPQGSNAPLDTVTSKGRFGKVAAYLEQANTGMVGHAATAPVSTIVGKGCTQRLVEMGMLPLDGSETSTRAHVLDFLWAHFGAPTQADWDGPLDTAQARLRFGLVIIDGVTWMIVDIGMRMLTPRELFNAQGFPKDYVIDAVMEQAVVVIEKNGRRRIRKPGRITKTEQTSMAGNSVSPPPARDILRANIHFWTLPERLAA